MALFISRIAEPRIDESFRRGKNRQLVDLIITNKVSVVAGTVTTDEGIAFSISQLSQRWQRRAPKLSGIMSPATSEFRIVWNGDGKLGSENTVVFHNHDYRIDNVYLLPDPIIVAIDVDAQEPNLTRKPRFLQEIVDVVPGNLR